MDVFIIIDLVILVILLIVGVPVGFCFAIALAFMVFVGGYDPQFLLPYGFAKMSSIVLIAIPLFIMAGGLMNLGGLSKQLLDFANAIVGRIRGGMGVTVIVACAIFGAISGSAAAAVATMGTITIPRMVEEGYPRGYAAALVANAGVLALLIPPSATMILYAWMTDQSVAACFLCTVGPGILLVIFMSAFHVWQVRSMPNVKYLPWPGFKKATREFATAGKNATFALLLPVIILGGIYGGFTTPTEAAAMATVYSFLIGFVIFRAFTIKTCRGVLVETATTTGVIMIMVFCIMMLSRIFIMESLPQKIAGLLTGISTNKYVILAMINVFLILVGMLMDDVSGILLTAPLLLPVVTAIGVSPIHFAAIIGVNLGLGNFTPPVAPLLYLGSRIGNVGVDKMLKPAFLSLGVVWLPLLILVTYVPDISLFLPRLAGFVP